MIAGLAVAAWPVAARADTAPGPLVISGFLDLVGDLGAKGSDEAVYRIGQAELDVDAEIAPNVGICIAPAWDPATKAVGLGTAVIHLGFAGDGPDNFCRDRHLDRSGLLAGRFDVPFGIDWLFYPSIDRPLVTMPLPVAATHGGWNADGVLLYGATGIVNGLVHATSGFDHARVRGDSTETIWTGRNAVGGRFGVVPSSWLALGVSAADIDAVEAGRSQLLLGLDFMAGRGPWSVRGEILSRRADAETDLSDKGWYVAAKWDFGQFYGMVRWDEWQPDGSDRDRRVSVGAGVPVRGAVMLRGEYEWWPDAGRRDRMLLQIAAGFGG